MSEVRLQWNGGSAVQAEGDVMDIQPIDMSDNSFDTINTSSLSQEEVNSPSNDTVSVTIIGRGADHIVKVGENIYNDGIYCPVGIPRTVRIGKDASLKIKALASA